MIKPINQSTCEKLQLRSNQLISCTSHAGTGGGREGRRFPRNVHSCSFQVPGYQVPRISSGGLDVPWVPRHRAPATECRSDNTHGEPKDKIALIEHPSTPATCTIFERRKFENPTKSEQLLCPIFFSQLVGFLCGFTSVCFEITWLGLVART